MSPHLPHSLVALFLALAACAPSDGGQVGEETIGCLPVETQVLEVDETSPLGFTPMDVLTLVDGSHTEALRWADGGETELTTSFSFASAANFQDREWVDAGSSEDGQPEPAPADLGDCADIVELSMTVTMQTTDGRLNESWAIALQAVAVDSSGFYQELEALQGSLDIQSYAPSGDFDSNRAFLDFTITPSGFDGEIVGQASGTDGQVAYAENYPIASFGPPPAS